jgi:hypothetical protein
VAVQQNAAGVRGVPESFPAFPQDWGIKGVESNINIPSAISPFLMAKEAAENEKVVNKHNLGIEL